MDNKVIREAMTSFGFDAATPISPLRESADNSVFIIGGKDRKVLRVSKRLPIEDIVFECEAVNYLAQGGVLVPRFLLATSGKYYAVTDDVVAVLFDFMDGRHIEIDKDHLPNLRQAFEAGKGLARIHNIGRSFTPSSTRRRTIFSEFGRALSLENLLINKLEGGKIFLDQVKKAIDFGKASSESIGLIHNDYRPSNVFFDKADHLTGIIDFDWSCMGSIIKDLALGVLEWSFPDGVTEPNFGIFDSFLEGYNSTADQKQARDRRLYDWIAFAALSDAATYFCDLVPDVMTTKRTISSYMYRKYQFFNLLKS